MKRAFFITATDTAVGKTAITLLLAKLFRSKGFSVGVFKPVQCAGNDCKYLKKHLGLDDNIRDINPYYLSLPVAPALAFSMEEVFFSKDKVFAAFKKLSDKYDIVLVEGAGGIYAPVFKDYLISDLIKDLDIPAVVVAATGLGAINHALLTVRSLANESILVKGIIFNKTSPLNKGLSERTNPEIIKSLSGLAVLARVPYLNSLPKTSLSEIQRYIDITKLLAPEIRADYEKLDKKYVWHPFTQMNDWVKEKQIIVERASGNYLKGTDGNWYLDAVSSLWVNVHGHGKKEIDSAIRSQLGKLSHSTLLGLGNTPSIELARQLLKIAPKGLAKVFFSDNGSTAVEAGLKMAYQYWQNKGRFKKKRIVHLTNSYHGDTLGSVSVGGIDLFHKVYKSLLFETISVQAPDCFRCRDKKISPGCGFGCLDKLNRLLKKDRSVIAGLIAEPIVQAAAGMIVWPKGALANIVKQCKQNEILFIADEVATGFGRTGKMFASDHENVTPDIMCVAKSISAGYLPIAATLTTEEIFKAFKADYKEQKAFFHGHTYTGNPLACAASLANLKIFKKERTLFKLKAKIKLLARLLCALKDLKCVGDVRQKGFMAGIELVKDKDKKTPFPWPDKIGIKVCELLRKDRIISRPLGNVIVVMPPFSITEEELKYLIECISKRIREATEKA